MGDGEHGRTQPAEELPQFDDEALAQAAVELAERLVEHQQFGARGQRPGQGYALLFSAGEHPHRTPPGAGQADQVQQLLDPADLFGPGHGAHPQSEGHIARDVTLRKELVVLEHQADTAPVHRHPALLRPVQQYPPGGRGLQTRHHPQQRRLAAAAGAEHTDRLVLRDRQIHRVQRHPLPEADRHTVQLQHQNSPERSVRMRSSTSSDTAHTSIRIVDSAIACP